MNTNLNLFDENFDFLLIINGITGKSTKDTKDTKENLSSPYNWDGPAGNLEKTYRNLIADRSVLE